MSQATFATSGSVLLAEGQTIEATVYFSGGTIERIEPGRDPGADLSTDGTVAPGLIDMQVNGAYGYDFTNDPGTVREVSERLPETGVTAFLPTLITSAFNTYPARLQEIALAIRETSGRGAAVLGAHLEGPYLNPLRKGAHPPAYLRPIDVDEIRRWADPSVVRVVTLAPELDGALEAVRVLREMDIVVSAGHSNATYDQAVAGFRAGIAWATHLYNAQSPLQHREPGLMGAILVSPVPCGLIVDGIHSHPAMVRLAWKAKGTGGITLVTDCMAAMGMPPGRFDLGHHTVTVTEDSVRLEDGTLAGSILTMDAALRNTMAFTGCSLAQAVTMASTTPAYLLGLEHKGLISPGFDADVVIFNKQNEVTHTFVGGRISYERRS